jgi:DNA-binding SARP family transcriptional activator
MPSLPSPVLPEMAGLRRAFEGRSATAEAGLGASLSARTDLLAAQVWRGGEPVKLSRFEHSIAVFLATRPNGASTEELADALFSHHALYSARRSIKVLVYRIRKKVGTVDYIRSDGGRYRLGDAAIDELRGIERQVRTHRTEVVDGGHLLDPAICERFRQWRERLRPGRPNFIEQQPWFEEMEWRLRHLERDLILVLAGDALARNDGAEVLELVGDLQRTGSLEEEVHELVIRAHLVLGDSSGALAEYRRYERTLEKELGVAPSEKLRQLILNAREHSSASRRC